MHRLLRLRSSVLPRQFTTKAMSKETAVFGGGCFWGMEKFFRKGHPELLSVSVGYMGGKLDDPSYEVRKDSAKFQRATPALAALSIFDPVVSHTKDVCSGLTGHAEVVKVEFDSTKTKYADLVNLFFRMHNPTTLNKQGNDHGTQYRSIIFTFTPEQSSTAHEAKQKCPSLPGWPWKSPVVTDIVDGSSLKYWPAEEYHQKYLERNPEGYCNHKLYF